MKRSSDQGRSVLPWLKGSLIVVAGIGLIGGIPSETIAQPDHIPALTHPAPIHSSPISPEGTLLSRSPQAGRELPDPVRNAVLTDLSNRTSLPIGAFTIAVAEPRQWPDGCLGLSAPDQFCTQVIVPGWQVIVHHNQQQWVYRTDRTGRQVRLAEQRTGSQRTSDNGSFALTQTCTNEAAGYTLRYPSGWQTNSGDVINQCRVFDPQPISLPPRSESLNEAIHLRLSDIAYERAIQREDFEMALSRRSRTVGGRPAVAIESQSTGPGLIPEGTRTYSYTVNLGNQILLATTYDLQGQNYQRNKQVLDQMMNSLAFNRPSAGSDPVLLRQLTDSTVTIAGLPDGNYRFCSDAPPQGINRVSGVCFRVRKTDATVVGDFYYPYEGSSVCLTGKVNGNTVTGQGLELLQPGSPPTNLPGETERTHWRRDGFLRVGRAERVDLSDRRDAIRYRSFILDLSNFYQYNAGPVLPPPTCF